jgi:hypothetical protein
MPWRRDQCAFEDQIAKASKDVVGARDEVITRVEERRAVVREEEGPELKGRGISLAVRILAHGNAAFAGLELGPRHAVRPLGPPHEPCRTPMVLSTSESSSPILTLTLAPMWSRITTLTSGQGGRTAAAQRKAPLSEPCEKRRGNELDTTIKYLQKSTSGAADTGLGAPGYFKRSWLCTQEHWNPELVSIFGAAACYRRVKVGSSLDYAHPDNSELHTCCGSVAALQQRPRHYDQVPSKNNKRCRGHRPRCIRII